MMMTWRGNVNRYMLRAMHWYKSFICVQKPSECPCSNRIAPPCTQVCYGVITAMNRCEDYVLHTTLFFLEKLPFYLRDCSAILMFAMRDLSTCKMLIRKHAYIFMKSAPESRNVILHRYCLRLLCGSTGEIYCMYIRSR